MRPGFAAGVFDMVDTVTPDPVLQDITFDPNTVQQADVVQTDPSSAWSGLDTVGSNVGNVASNVFSSFGNLVSAQINKTALLTATGAVGRSNTAAPTANPNVWKIFVGIGVAIVGGIVLFHAVRRK
jgi:hypothetical protein